MDENATERWVRIAGDLLSCPTAPLMEDLTAQHVWDFARQRRSLFRRQDAAGNIVIGYPASGNRSSAPLVVVSHLDHPAFHVSRVDGSKVCLRFRGGVRAEHVREGERVRFFERGNPVAIGRGALTRIVAQNERVFEADARLRSGRAASPGFANWDLPAFRQRGQRICACACDDLMGCATALCALDELHRSRPRGGSLWVLFTRAEELGFYGALLAAKAHVLPRRSRVISLECSRALPAAPQGNGVILRVGDSAGVFDPKLCEAMRQGAEDLREKESEFCFQRRLMDGGACEAFAFGQAGYRAAGLALPLANYHNQAGLDGGRKAIGEESVLLGDFTGAVRLVLHLACGAKEWPRWERAAGKRLGALARQASREIAACPLEVRG
jgi:putative aminopeptidase FrvX